MKKLPQSKKNALINKCQTIYGKIDDLIAQMREAGIPVSMEGQNASREVRSLQNRIEQA